MRPSIYINVGITNYRYAQQDCILTQQVGDEPMTIEHISYDKACKLMWELKLAGGKRTVNINYLDPHIYQVDTYIFLPM